MIPSNFITQQNTRQAHQAVFITGFMCHFILMTQKYILERLKNKSFGPQKLSGTKLLILFIYKWRYHDF